MKNILFTLTALILLSTNLLAQDQLVITGVVFDKVTQKPMPYAHVGIPEKGIGTTTGHDGRFKFKVPRRYVKSTMMVSYMGYKTFRQSINTIKIPAKIGLVRSQNKLKEIVVTDGNFAEDIIRRAVRAIPKNYSTHPTKHLAFYRESRTDDSLRYRYMAEGVLNVYKRSYTSSKEGQVSLVQGRCMNLKNPLDTIIHGGLDSGHMAAHRFDIVQNREDFLNERFFPVYKYWIERTTTYNDRPVYVIGFEKDENAKEEVKTNKKKKKGNGLIGLVDVFRKNKKRKVNEPAKARLKGFVYVDTESYAIIRSEFEVTKRGLRKTNDYPLYAGSWRKNAYVVNYRQLGDKWYFSDALREGNLRGTLYTNEVKITEINTEKAKPLPYLERMARSQAFSRMTGEYDPDFWASYNTTPISAGLAESIMQMENVKKAQEVFDTENMLALQRTRDSIRYAEQVRLASLQAEVDEDGEPVDPIDLDFSEFRPKSKSKKNVRRKRSGFKFNLGMAAHLIESKAEGVSLQYLSDENESIFALTEDIPLRRFEVITNIDADIFIKPNYFIRVGKSWDYLNSIYREHSIGMGGEWNISKRRPVFFKLVAQYDRLKYARKLGVVDNDYGKFKVDGKKFNAKSLKLYYGSRTHHLKLSTEIAVELMPDREFYVRGTYFLPFAQSRGVWLKERRQFFNKKRYVDSDELEVVLTRDGMRYEEKIPNGGTFMIAVGFVFK